MTLEKTLDDPSAFLRFAKTMREQMEQFPDGDHSGIENYLAKSIRHICELAIKLDEFANVIPMVQELSKNEADTVTFLCPNPDPKDDEDRIAIICNGAWTNWRDMRFSGASLHSAVERAYTDYKQAEHLSATLDAPEVERAFIQGLPLSGDALRGGLAYALTLRRVIDMPTARAIIDEAIDSFVEFRHGEIVTGKYDRFQGRVIGYYLTNENTPGVVVQELGTKIKHIYANKDVVRG